RCGCHPRRTGSRSPATPAWRSPPRRSPRTAPGAGARACETAQRREDSPSPMVFHDLPDPSEREFDRSLRPGTFGEFVGQEQIRDNLRIAITAARTSGEPLDHVLLCGPPGLGKTTLAYLIAQGMGADIVLTSGPALGAPKDLA